MPERGEAAPDQEVPEAETARDDEQPPAEPPAAPEPAPDFLHDDDEEIDLGRPGRPLNRRSPFLIGFFGAAGALLAWFLGGLLLDVGSVILLVVVALFLAVGLNPLVEMLMRRGLPRPWSVLVVIIAVLISLALFLLAITPIVADQVASLKDNAPGWFDRLQHLSVVQTLDDKYGVVSKLRNYVEHGDLAKRAAGGALGVGLAVLSFLGNAFVVIVLTLYFLGSLPSIKRGVYRLAPSSRRERVAALGDQVLRSIGGYVSGAFVVATCAGLSTVVFLLVIGLGKYAVALGLVVALLDVIPMIGATLGAVIVCAIGFATDLKTGIICVIFYIAYQQVENYLIYPRVMSRSVDIPGAVTVIAALVGASLLGVVGALLAIPTAASILLLVREVFIPRQDLR